MLDTLMYGVSPYDLSEFHVGAGFLVMFSCLLFSLRLSDRTASHLLRKRLSGRTASHLLRTRICHTMIADDWHPLDSDLPSIQRISS